MEEREKSLCFTGHRPQKLPYGMDEDHDMCRRLKARLRTDIEAKIQAGVENFYCGMAWGTDIWCGEIVQDLKAQYPHIRLIACIPHIGQEKGWNEGYIARYHSLLQSADESIVFYDHYVKGCMQKRNRYMVDATAHIIAVFNGSPGGTKSTIEYAQRKGLDIILLDPDRMVRKHLRNQ